MRIRYLLLHAYGTGGTTRTVFNQANSMVAAGHDVELVSVLRRRDDVRFPLDERVTVTSLVDQRGTPSGPEARAERKRPKYIPAGEMGIRYFSRDSEKAVIDYLRGLRDGILVTTRPALNVLSARFAAKGVVRVAQEHMNLSVHAPDVRAAIARYYREFPIVAVLTERDREEYAELLPRTRVVRIPNAVHSMEQQRCDPSARIAVAAGRLFTQKGFDMLIPAFAKAVERHPDWQLRIYGQGEKRDMLRGLIERHHMYNHIFLMGHTEKLDDELAKSSFYVLSSRFEGLPMVMIEAMAHALPVVSFDCPTGPRDVVTDGRDGLLVPANDIDGLGEAMSRLMDDEELRSEMGSAALKTAREFAPEAVHPAWDRLFAELAEGAK